MKDGRDGDSLEAGNGSVVRRCVDTASASARSQGEQADDKEHGGGQSVKKK